MPFTRFVDESHKYWCPKWYWPFAVCTRTERVEQWCYDFAWLEVTSYVFVSYNKGCENGTLFTWYTFCWLLVGTANYPGGQMCFDSPRTNSGRCAR